MHILVVTGMPGSGKEEFLGVATGMGISFVRMGDIVRETYASSDAASQGLSVGGFASREREVHGKNIWAKRAAERMSDSLFLVDGCRSMDEVRSYRELGGEVTIIAIHAPPNQRYDRLVKRNRDDAPRNTAEFDERDRRELSWGLGDAIALSDVMIDNSGTLQMFKSKAGEILEGFR